MLASLELKLYLWTKSLWWFCRSHRRQEKSRSNCISLLIILRSALSPFACWHKWKLDSNHASTASGGLGTGIWSALGVKLWDPTFNLTWSVLLWAFVKPFYRRPSTRLCESLAARWCMWGLFQSGQPVGSPCTHLTSHNAIRSILR